MHKILKGSAGDRPEVRRKSGASKYPFTDMKVDDYFIITEKEVRSCRSTFYRWRKGTGRAMNIYIGYSSKVGQNVAWRLPDKN